MLARDALLKLLYPDNAYTDAELVRVTQLDRGGTIPKILGKQPGNIQQGKLEQFFERLLRLLKRRVCEGRLNQNQVDSYLRRHQLAEPFRLLWEIEQSFYLPSRLYESGNQFPRSSRIRKETRRKTKVSNDNIANLFWNLDYKRQERKFQDALEESSQCLAFAIAAPCETTQKWILNRLMRQIPNQENALSLAFNLKQHPMRHRFENFWENLSQFLALGTKSLKDEVLQGLCHRNVDRPIILTIYEMRQFEKVQKQILQHFWEPLTQQIVDSTRSERSRIVLFLVDQCCPGHDANQLLKLDPLEAIPPQDVTAWLTKDSVAPYWQAKFGDSFRQTLIERLERENCQEPYFVLDRICFELGIEGGLVDIEEAWKWAS